MELKGGWLYESECEMVGAAGVGTADVALLVSEADLVRLLLCTVIVTRPNASRSLLYLPSVMCVSDRMGRSAAGSIVTYQ